MSTSDACPAFHLLDSPDIVIKVSHQFHPLLDSATRILLLDFWQSPSIVHCKQITLEES